MDEAFYPIITKEAELPVCICGVGWCEWQYHVIRENGYPQPQVNMCANGGGILVLDGKEYEISKGMSFFLPADYPHEYYTTKNGWENHWLVFGGADISGIQQQLMLTKPIINDHGDNTSLEAVWKRIFKTVKSQKPSAAYTCSALAYDFLIEYYKGMCEHEQRRSRGIQNSIKPILQYIDENYSKDILLEELAAIAGITPQHLCKLFRREYNMRPFEYITRRRIQQAKKLLLEDKLTIAEIAETVGFHDSSYFCRVFRQYEQMSPRQFVSD